MTTINQALLDEMAKITDPEKLLAELHRRWMLRRGASTPPVMTRPTSPSA